MTSLMANKADIKPEANLAFHIKQSALVNQKKRALQELEDRYEDGELSDQEVAQKLVELTGTASEEENKLRQSFHVDDKPSFISTQLENLARKVKEKLKVIVSEKPEGARLDSHVLAADELLVYIHLFHTQGEAMRSWRGLLSPDIFRECSITRPVYLERSHVTNLIASNKDNKVNHAYVVVKIKKLDIKENQKCDEYGQPLLQLKPGALDLKNVISFVHNEQSYQLGPQGEPVKALL